MEPIGGRSDYRQGKLDRKDLTNEPHELLQRWINDALNLGITESFAMCISTVAANGQPSSRFVLLRELDERGLTFFTHFDSRKGHEIEGNPQICAAFWWKEMERQVRVEGTAERATDEESDRYFSGRPHESQLASAASPQSSAIESRTELVERVGELRTKYPDQVPRPATWGGYRLRPSAFEFWQGRLARLHDRFLYERAGDRWVTRRLAP